jgi:beta-glucosidase
LKKTLTGAAISEVLSEEESEKESGEGTDRATLHYSGVQMELFRQLCGLGKKIITVAVQGRPLLLDELLEKSSSLVITWYPGSLGGQAIGEAIFGECNIAGRLPVSLPRSEGQLPIHYNALEPRRDYVDMTAKPLLPFGFGLSYSKFEYSELQCQGNSVKVKVKNIGEYDGDEVVQCYLTAMTSPIQRPILELCGFERVFIKAGETEEVEFNISDNSLGCFDRMVISAWKPNILKSESAAIPKIYW